MRNYTGKKRTGKVCNKKPDFRAEAGRFFKSTTTGILIESFFKLLLEQPEQNKQ